jgi:hypothetical protein
MTRVCAQPQRTGRVDEQQPTVFGPAEKGAQEVGLLVTGLRGRGPEGLQVGGGDFGPAGQSAAAGEVLGEIAQDSQLCFDGDVADRACTDSAEAFSVAQLQLIELSTVAGRSAAGTVSSKCWRRVAARRWASSAANARPWLVKKAVNARDSSCCGANPGLASSSRPSWRSRSTAPPG